MKKSRKYVGNQKVTGVYPKADVLKSDGTELASIGLRLDRKEVEQLRNLLNNALEANWNYLNLTGYRKTKRVTVTYKE